MRGARGRRDAGPLHRAVAQAGPPAQCVQYGSLGTQNPHPPSPATPFPAAPQAAGDAPALLQGLRGPRAEVHPGAWLPQGALSHICLLATASTPSAGPTRRYAHLTSLSSAPLPRRLQRFGRVASKRLSGSATPTRQPADAAAPASPQPAGGAKKVRGQGPRLRPGLPRALHRAPRASTGPPGSAASLGRAACWLTPPLPYTSPVLTARVYTSLSPPTLPAPGPQVHVPLPGRGLHPRGCLRVPPGGRHLQPRRHPPAGHLRLPAHPRAGQQRRAHRRRAHRAGGEERVVRGVGKLGGPAGCRLKRRRRLQRRRVRARSASPPRRPTTAYHPCPPPCRPHCRLTGRAGPPRPPRLLCPS